jgi:TrmH family RNA methyltransferase
MKSIKSSHNDTYKRLKQLAGGAKYRKRYNQTLIEGVHLCQSYLQHKHTPAMYVYSESAPDNPEVSELMDICDKVAVPSVRLSDRHFKAISSVKNGIGILFVIDIPSPKKITTTKNGALLLEDVQDPGNMGTILRTAAAAGVTQVFTSNGSTSAWSPKVLRAGMGAHFAVQVYENADLAKLIADSKIQILATSLDATETIYQKDLAQPTAWLFGNEGQGVSEDLMAPGVDKVIIPQNPGIESLNVAASVAICLFEQVRQTNHKN